MTTAIYASSRKVSTLSLYDARCSVASIREEHFRATGLWCTDAEALAAAYSVPDGAPADMAAANVGVELRDGDRRSFERMRAGVRSLTR